MVEEVEELVSLNGTGTDEPYELDSSLFNSNVILAAHNIRFVRQLGIGTLSGFSEFERL